MRITTFFAALAFSVVNVAPADACRVSPPSQYMYWPAPPEMLGPDEVALEVVFVRHPSVAEFLSKDPNADDVIITSCDGVYAYRVLRVLRGSYKGPSEINTSVYGGIANELYDGQSRIVVGKLHESNSPYFHVRAFRQPDPDTNIPQQLPMFPVPEIRLN